MAMKICITNDDGIQSEGLLRLVTWAQNLGEVCVYAPKVEQSAKSHAVEIHKPFEAKPAQVPGAVRAWAVDSTPADCVRFAVLGQHEKFDLVISGVNRGLNIGQDIMYSGTVGAIFEAANLGIPGISFSTTIGFYEGAVTQMDRVWEYFQTHKLMEKGSHYNVNIPADAQTIRITRQGGPYYSDDFPHIGNDMYMPKGICVYENRNDLTLDTDSVMSGHISIMPLSTNRVDLELYADLQQLNP